MQPTIKDLAKETKLSLATIDRVLNKRPNVSKKTIKQVNEAIERIGFVRNFAAVNLAKNKVYKFRFILPDVGDLYLNAIISQINATSEALKSNMILVEYVQIIMNDPHVVANYLTQLNHNEIDGLAILAPKSSIVRDSMIRLHERGIKVVQFLSGQDRLKKLDFVGINNLAAGATAGRIIGNFLSGKTGKVITITETMQSMDSIERRCGFDEVLNSKFPNLQVLPSLETYSDIKRTERIIARTFQNQKNIMAAYIISSEAREPITRLSTHYNLKDIIVIAHECTKFTAQALLEEKIDAVIAQNPGHAVRSAIRILSARMENRQPIAAQEKIRIEILLKENL